MLTVHPTYAKTINGPVAEFGGLLYSALSVASMAASAYHGGKRHGGSIGWTIAWGLLGAVFPVITPTIAAVQGFGECKYDCGRR